jgi:hypothetical protein
MDKPAGVVRATAGFSSIGERLPFPGSGYLHLRPAE